MENIPVAVLVNKIDVEGAAGAEEIICDFGLYGLSTGKVRIDIYWLHNLLGKYSERLSS